MFVVLSVNTGLFLVDLGHFYFAIGLLTIGANTLSILLVALAIGSNYFVSSDVMFLRSTVELFYFSNDKLEILWISCVIFILSVDSCRVKLLLTMGPRCPLDRHFYSILVVESFSFLYKSVSIDGIYAILLDILITAFSLGNS